MDIDNELVIIQHGFLGTIDRFDTLKKYLTDRKYYVIANQIKTAGRPLFDIYNEFEGIMNKIPFERYSKIHIVAHSLGCPLIRMYLAKFNIPKLDTVILIAGPNSNLTFKPGIFYKAGQMFTIFRPLQDLNLIVDTIKPINNKPMPKIGVIAGSKNNLPTARDVSGVNDGLVAVTMAVPANDRITEMKVVPYNHFEIYQVPRVHAMIYSFITTKKF